MYPLLFVVFLVESTKPQMAVDSTATRKQKKNRRIYNGAGQHGEIVESMATTTDRNQFVQIAEKPQKNKINLVHFANGFSKNCMLYYNQHRERITHTNRRK